MPTARQNSDLQSDELPAGGCWKVYGTMRRGHWTGGHSWTGVLEDLRAGDTLVVWRPGRLRRSLRESFDTMGGGREQAGNAQDGALSDAASGCGPVPDGWA